MEHSNNPSIESNNQSFSDDLDQLQTQSVISNGNNQQISSANSQNISISMQNQKNKQQLDFSISQQSKLSISNNQSNLNISNQENVGITQNNQFSQMSDTPDVDESPNIAPQNIDLQPPKISDQVNEQLTHYQQNQQNQTELKRILKQKSGGTLHQLLERSILNRQSQNTTEYVVENVIELFSVSKYYLVQTPVVNIITHESVRTGDKLQLKRGCVQLDSERMFPFLQQSVPNLWFCAAVK